MEEILNATTAITDVTGDLPVNITETVPLDSITGGLAGGLTGGMGNMVMNQIMTPPNLYYAIAVIVVVALLIGTVIYLLVATRNQHKRIKQLEAGGVMGGVMGGQMSVSPQTGMVQNPQPQFSQPSMGGINANPMMQQNPTGMMWADGTPMTSQEFEAEQKPLNKRSMWHLLKTAVRVTGSGKLREYGQGQMQNQQFQTGYTNPQGFPQQGQSPFDPYLPQPPQQDFNPYLQQAPQNGMPLQDQYHNQVQGGVVYPFQPSNLDARSATHGDPTAPNSQYPHPARLA